MSHAVTIFISAFLLFQVQPIIAKYILPWYGGSPSVWTTCLLFFQIGLLLGYAYAHLIVKKLNIKKQIIVHLSLLIVACIFLPITPSEALKPGGAEDPMWGIVKLLLSTVGVPYILISATGPLLQHWYEKKNEGKSPYRLYALSNVGSLLGLLSYPFIFERAFNLDTQTIFWSVGFLVYVVACGWAGMMLYRVADNIKEKIEEQLDGGKLGWKRPVMWMGLSACGSLMLLATTNKITQDVAVIPFLWIAPLSLYLISFIIAFDSPRWYNRYIWIPLFIGSIILMTYILNQDKLFDEWSIEYQLIGYCFGLLSICMVCHGEMVRLKPSPGTSPPSIL